MLPCRQLPLSLLLNDVFLSQARKYLILTYLLFTSPPKIQVKCVGITKRFLKQSDNRHLVPNVATVLTK